MDLKEKCKHHSEEISHSEDSVKVQQVRVPAALSSTPRLPTVEKRFWHVSLDPAIHHSTCVRTDACHHFLSLTRE